MSKFRSLAEFLGETEPEPSEAPPGQPADAATAASEDSEGFYLESLSGQEFADAILSSRIFRRYIIDSMKAGTLPATIATRLMDYGTNWGKPPERHEHTGKDGRPIETVTEVRRVIVRSTQIHDDFDEEGPSAITH